ncbi:Ig-like domain-containing protein [Sphingomonas sp. MMS24-JH45]
MTVTAAQASRGTVTIRPDGTLRYVPDADFNGVDTIAYRIDDGHGGIATGTVTVTVTPVEDAPVARDGAARTAEDTPVRIAVPATDVDGDPLTVTAATATRGSVTINVDGTVTYRPAADFAGTDTDRYTVSDGQGGTATAIVTVTVDPVNDVPVVPGRAPIDAVGGRPLRIDALAGAIDGHGDPLTLVRATAANGTVVVARDGTLVFTPPLGFCWHHVGDRGGLDGRGGDTSATFIVRVADGRGADIEQLLRFGRVTFRDPAPALAVVPLADGVARNPLAILTAVQAIQPPNSTAIGDRPVVDAVGQAIRTLRGTAVDADAPIAAEVARLDTLRDRREAGDRLVGRSLERLPRHRRLGLLRRRRPRRLRHGGKRRARHRNLRRGARHRRGGRARADPQRRSPPRRRRARARLDQGRPSRARHHRASRRRRRDPPRRPRDARRWAHQRDPDRDPGRDRPDRTRPPSAAPPPRGATRPHPPAARRHRRRPSRPLLPMRIATGELAFSRLAAGVALLSLSACAVTPKPMSVADLDARATHVAASRRPRTRSR